MTNWMARDFALARPGVVTSFNETATQQRNEVHVLVAIATLASFAFVLLSVAIQIVRTKWAPPDDNTNRLASEGLRAATGIDADRQEVLLAELSSLELAELAGNLAELCALDALTETDRRRVRSATWGAGERIWHEPIEPWHADPPRLELAPPATVRTARARATAPPRVAGLGLGDASEADFGRSTGDDGEIVSV